MVCWRKELSDVRNCMCWQNRENRNMGITTWTYWADIWQQICPTGASTLPNMGTLLAPVGQICCQTHAQYIHFVTLIFLFPGFCQRIQILSSEFLSSDNSFYQQTIQTIGWQLDESQLSVCQNITAKNQMVWQFFSNSWFFVNLGGDISSVSVCIK